jgi:hypothetical protein
MTRFRNGKLGTTFVKKLPCSDPKRLKVASTVEHFAVL